MTETMPDLYEVAHDDDAEQAVLGGVLVSKDARNDVEAVVTPEDFYRPANAAVYAAAMALHGEGQPVDAVAVAKVMREHGELARAGGPAYLSSLMTSLASAASAGFHAREVRAAAQLRLVAEQGVRLQQVGMTPGADAVAAVESAQKALDVAEHRLHGLVSTDGLGADLDETIDRMEGGERGQSTGIADLDHYIGGMRAGSMIVLGGTPGSGKSLVGEQVALHAAMPPHNLPVFVASLEMTRYEWLLRAFAQLEAIDLGSLMRGDLSEPEWERVARARGRLADVALRVDDRESVTIPDIRAAARAFFRRHGSGLIVVDYLQMVRPTGRHGTREREVAEVADGCKQSLAKGLGVPVLALAQLGRDHVRANRRPTMHDLRESGSLEQYADVVALLHRDEDAAPDVLEVGIGKNRHGPKGGFSLTWEGQYARVRARAWSPGDAAGT